MQIGTYCTSPIHIRDMGDRSYRFKPVVDGDNDSIPVCEVVDKDHVAWMLASGAYFKMAKDADPHQRPSRTPAPQVESQRPQLASQQILNMTLKGLRTAMRDKQFTVQDLRQARQMEMGKPGNEKRDAVIACIDQFIAGIEIEERRNDNPAIPKVGDVGLAGRHGQDIVDTNKNNDQE
jgi:hypothetical protein